MGAEAAPTWLAPTKLSTTGQNAEQPQVSVDPAGDAITVWERFDEKAGKKVIEASSRPAAAAGWQSSLPISNAKEDASLPQVALDSYGDAFAAWLSFNGAEYTIQASTRSGVSGSWQPPVTIQKLGATTVTEPRPDLAVDAQGDAVVVWERAQAAEVFVEASSKPVAHSWAVPETLSEVAEALHPPEVAIDAAGDATAVWEQHEAGSVVIAESTRPAGSKWQMGVALSATGKNANEPRVAVDAQGDAVAVWERPNEEGKELVEAATRSGSNGSWAKPAALMGYEGLQGEPAGQQAAIDGQGRAVVTWSRLDAAAHDVVEAAVGRASTSSWQPPVALSSPAGLVEEAPQVGVDNAGAAVVVWEQWTATTKIIEAVSGLAASGSWGAPVALSAAGKEADEAQVALDSQGNAVAVWRRFDGASYIAEAAGFDAAGPLFTLLRIPSAGTVGQPLAFSASGLDVWSGLGGMSWGFGDGGAQVGASVTHVYDAPGTYTVSVTAADALGNTSSATAAVSIAAGTGTGTSGSGPPVLTSARLSHSRFRVTKHVTAISAKARAPLGTSFHFTLSETAKVRIVLTRIAAGLRSGKRCLAPSAKLRRHHAKRCTRSLGAGTLTRANERAGADSIAFSGRVGTKALTPGSYRATLVAFAGGLTSSPTALSFTVVR